jgi:hypothetical protein
MTRSRHGSEMNNQYTIKIYIHVHIHMETQINNYKYNLSGSPCIKMKRRTVKTTHELIMQASTRIHYDDEGDDGDGGRAVAPIP